MNKEEQNEKNQNSKIDKEKEFDGKIKKMAEISKEILERMEER